MYQTDCPVAGYSQRLDCAQPEPVSDCPRQAADILAAHFQKYCPTITYYPLQGFRLAHHRRRLAEARRGVKTRLPMVVAERSVKVAVRRMPWR